MSQLPILLLREDLLGPVELAQSTLRRAMNHVSHLKDAPLLRQGLFVLGVASVEVMLADVLTVILTGIPEKLPSGSVSIQKPQLLDRRSRVLEDHIESHVRNLTYQSVSDLLRAFSRVLGIGLEGFTEGDRQKLVEIKESRNLLLHAGLRVNSMYLNNAGRFARASDEGTELDIDDPYLLASLATLQKLCHCVDEELGTKYANYTKLRAIRALWDYLFDSPLLRFDDCWISDESEDTVRLKKTAFGSIGSAEHTFLAVWLNSYNQSGNEHFRDFDMRKLDDEHQGKLLWFLGVLRNFRVY